MAYTELKLNYLLETKEKIREAIEAKGQAVADKDTFRSYAEKIEKIPKMDGSFRYFSGSFRPTAEQETITHSMGEVPDIILVIPNKEPTLNTIIYTMGFSQAMIDKTNGARNYVAYLTSQGSFRMYASEGIENDFGTDRPYGKYGGIRKVTDSTFTIGSSDGKLAVGNAYDYYAVCGIV